MLLWGLGMIGELMTINRRLLEEMRINQRRKDAEGGRLRGRAEYLLIRAKEKITPKAEARVKEKVTA